MEIKHKKVFLLTPNTDFKVSSYARSLQEEYKEPAFNLAPKTLEDDRIPFGFRLKKVINQNENFELDDNLEGLNDIWPDYLPNDLVWPLFSEKLRLVFDNSLTGNEAVKWLQASVIGNGEKRLYYVLYFSKSLDTLDVQATSYVPNTDVVIVPCFSKMKIQQYNAFFIPFSYKSGYIPNGFYVTDVIKDAILQMGIRGICFDESKTN